MIKKKTSDLLKFISALILSKLIKMLGKGKDIWIITERRDECKDNGYHLFKYIREHYPQKKVYYAIEKNSSQLDKINFLGNIIYYNSFKHYLFSLLASRLIGAFFPIGIPDSISFYKFNKIITGKKVFLQHGIIKEKIESLLYKNTQLDLFACGAEPEYEFVRDYFGYPNEIVKYLGLCRYDNLLQFETKKQILLMPTWRQYLPSQSFTKKNTTEEIEALKRQFLHSDYYKYYSELLMSHKLHVFLNQMGYVLVFYLHHELQPYLLLFKNKCKNIIVASDSEYDVQQLLKESEFLITDYSSIAFDFAYMNKPIIYYQFDEEEYYQSHYSKGYFDYRTMGFGAVVENQDDLVDKLFKSYNYQKNKFCSTNKYIYRSSTFFKIKDTFNCKRTADAITNL